MLQYFLKQILQQNIRVVIVEGSYHPAAHSKKNDLLNHSVVAWLSQKAAEFPEIIFIRKASLPALDANDFKDGYHLTADVGSAYAKTIFNQLDRLN